MKSKLLPITLLVLILLNAVLIFMLMTKKHDKKNQEPRRGFLTEQLQFTPDQEKTFFKLDAIHKEKMMDLDHQIMRQKDVLFNSFGNESINIDSIVKITGSLEAKKDLEVFTFFSAVKKICTKEQEEKFSEIINTALRGPKRRRPAENDRNHPPREGGMPPPHAHPPRE